MANKIISIFVSHLGCPHDCAYCNQEKITGHKKAHYRSIEEIQTDIDKQVSTIKCNQNHVEIAFYGGSFTGLPLDYQKQLLNAATAYVLKYKLSGIRFSTRPDYITPDIMKYLREYPIKAIELGVQSLNEQVLFLSKRGHTIQQVFTAVQCIKEAGYQVGIQIMSGLPGDSLNSFKETVEKVIGLSPDFVRIYPTLVLTGTDLAVWYKQKLYIPWSMEETIKNIAAVLPLFYQANIPIIRLGLQENEDLATTGTILAGPHHPNIRQHVESQYFLDLLLQKGRDLCKDDKLPRILDAVIHPADETAIRGKNNTNSKKFNETFSCTINFIKDSKQPKNYITFSEWHNPNGG